MTGEQGRGVIEDNLTGSLTGRGNSLTGGRQVITEEMWKVFWMVFATPEEHSISESMVGLEL